MKKNRAKVRRMVIDVPAKLLIRCRAELKGVLDGQVGEQWMRNKGSITVKLRYSSPHVPY